MSAPAGVSYRKAKSGSTSYVVLYRGQSIGTVGRFTMGAGQFGQGWMAATPSRKKSIRYPTRDAAAAWLVNQTRA